MKKTWKVISVVFTLIVVSMIGSMVGNTTTKAAVGDMALSVGGGFISDPNGEIVLHGYVYREDGTSTQDAIVNNPMEGATVEIYAGYLYLDDYDNQTPILTTQTNAEGLFVAKLVANENDRTAFSFKISKDGEKTVYSGAASGAFAWWWPNIKLETKGATINKNDALNLNDLIVGTPTFTYDTKEFDKDVDLGGNRKLKFVQEIDSSKLKTDVAGVYQVTITYKVKHFNSVGISFPIGEYIDTKIETQVVYVTVLETESTSEVWYVDGNGKEIASKESYTGLIGSKFDFPIKEIKGYKYKEVLYPSSSSEAKFETTNQVIKVVYTKVNEPISKPDVATKQDSDASTSSSINNKDVKTGDESNLNHLYGMFTMSFVSLMILIWNRKRSKSK
ncbi:hypothetical protein M2475_001234 [Breznakia sp. PF5-3]|uniref:MucBP domain-containing protein n=1 Tax=unclassified Breznakia TaxID=2623764 RepID=UPI002404B232|nr:MULTISPECIES: MucBP domain-containing protein [unclassified Breznakia]MDF9824768.1 hypothetical protein [Breznakia sp. PM6-1]MDF9835665.1 hypothetical protein [Breznakia sp. PF5-3]MDF9837714.1 hypothetical protein [Breznakia sp. PFB2-8]MDF9859675.1 hypothetical protein [Breznakia sp. PH5-24]